MRARSPPSRLIGDEPRLAYNRELLSSVLVRETAPRLGAIIHALPGSWAGPQLWSAKN
jgi:hypothetical protein